MPISSDIINIVSKLFLLLENWLLYLIPRSLALKIIKHLTSWKFPTVKWITTKDLARWLEDPVKPQPVILDARTEAEYAVSHLKQAQRIDPYNFNLSVLTESKDTPIVVYCSVGYRSARIAEQVEQAGFSHVYNLEGSLFQWANEERPIYTNDYPTALVHPYDQHWGRLLKPKYRAQVNKVETVPAP